MIKIFTDGASRGNPGPSASAFMILNQQDQILKQDSKYLGIGTNNQAEYNALISALEAALEFKEDVQCFSDSNLLVNQMNGNWKVKHPTMKLLWRKAVGLKEKFHKITFSHVPRTNKYIQKVDELANIQLDELKTTDNKIIAHSSHKQARLLNRDFVEISSNKKPLSQDNRRIYPAYQTGSEYQRQRNQVDEMVEGFVRFTTSQKVGETDNFIIEIDSQNNNVLLKERNIIVDCPFKLSMNENEAKKVIMYLTKAVEKLQQKKE